MKPHKQKKYKLIFNPHSGTKRYFFLPIKSTSLENLVKLFYTHNIAVDTVITQRSHHAQDLAKEAVKNGYDVILIAGGDGTVGEAVNGIVGSDVTVGILPFGTYMNVSRMLGIPNDLKRAISLIVKGNTQTIDLGVVTKLEGNKLEQPYYFLESAGVGFEAEIHDHFYSFERGNLVGLFRLFDTIRSYYWSTTTIILDKRTKIETKASVVSVSNGAYSGPALKLTPKAKLNDHKLVVSVYQMSKWEFLRHLLRIKTKKIGHDYSSKVQKYYAKEVTIQTKRKRMVHADARFFGTTPVVFSVKPKAVKIISGRISKENFVKD